MITQIFTFGGSHQYPDGYVEIHGEDPMDCRKKMMNKYGQKWAFQYNTENEAGVNRWGLTKVETIE